MKEQFKITKDSKQLEGNESGANFNKIDLGLLKDLGKYSIENTDFHLKNEGKVFLKDLLGLTSSEISINLVPAGFKSPFKHKHKENEEVYFIIKGKGTMGIDGKKFDVKEGSFIKVSPKAIRTIDNNSPEDMIFLVIQAKEGSLGQFTLTDGEIIH